MAAAHLVLLGLCLTLLKLVQPLSSSVLCTKEVIRVHHNRIRQCSLQLYAQGEEEKGA